MTGGGPGTSTVTLVLTTYNLSLIHICHARLLQNVHIEIQDARVAHDERHRVLLALDKALVQVEVILPVRIRYVGIQRLQSCLLYTS